MQTQRLARRQIADFANRLALLEGAQDCLVDGVTLVRHSHDLIKFPVLYGPCLVFVVQGRKSALFGSNTFVYDQDHFLILTTLVPFVWSAITEKRKPVLSVFVHFSSQMVWELLSKMEIPGIAANKQGLAVFEAQQLTSDIADVLHRLLRSATDVTDAKLLGPSIVRELVYRALRGPGGPSIRASLDLSGHFGQIARAIQQLQSEPAVPISVSEMAANVGMSLSVFHQSFKQITKTSPLRYLKTLRLHRGRTLMLSEASTVAEAAQRVGYESSSQFSREYKRLFGKAPAAETAKLRAEAAGFKRLEE